MGTQPAVYAAPLIITEKKSDTDFESTRQRKISLQMDQLQRASMKERDLKLGQNWTQDMKDFYSLNYSSNTPTPSYRPRVIFPELQYLMMSEATDLTNDMPRVYISINGKRDEKREKAFAGAWRNGMVNNRIFEAVLWSQFVNPSWLQIGFDSNARSGRGAPWVRSRDPETVYPDPVAKNDKDWGWVMFEDFMFLDEIRRMWPEKGQHIKAGPGYDDVPETEGSSYGLSFELPPGPLRINAPDGFENSRKGPKKRIRYLFVRDYARERVEEIAGVESANGFDLVIRPEMKWRFPHGRFIAECDGVILADGPNFVPKLPEDDFGTFPIIGIWSLPHLDSIYGPPPIRYGRSAQDLAERMYTQLFENMIRLNNGQTFIPEDSGIDIDAYGGLPGEVQTYRGDKTPEIKWPGQIPQHMTQIPELLLAKVARYQGFSDSRQGNAGQGNISTDMFDASVFQSQTITRMKARMLAESMSRLCHMYFLFMARFKMTPDTFQPALSDKGQKCEWNPVDIDDDCQLQLDESSVKPMSSTALKQLVLALSKTGSLPNKFIFETLGLPGADELAEDAEKQQQLAALAKLKRPR